MARFLKSETTGAVLPYNAKLAQRPNVVEISSTEALSLLAIARKGKKRPEEEEPFFEEVQEKVVASAEVLGIPQDAVVPTVAPEVVLSDVSAGEPDIDEVMKSLGVE